MHSGRSAKSHHLDWLTAPTAHLCSQPYFSDCCRLLILAFNHGHAQTHILGSALFHWLDSWAHYLPSCLPASSVRVWCVQESGMDDVWARLRTATQNDEALVAFVQCLLTLDPGARANFGALVETHLHMQPASQPVPVPGSLAASSAAASTPASSTITVSRDAAIMPRLDLDKDVMQRLQSSPGLASVWWDPTSMPVCHLSSGSVYRYIT